MQQGETSQSQDDESPGRQTVVFARLTLTKRPGVRYIDGHCYINCDDGANVHNGNMYSIEQLKAFFGEAGSSRGRFVGEH